MSKNKIELTIGILLISVPFFGIPSQWKMLFYIICGIVCTLFAIVGHFKRRSEGILETHNENI